MPDAAVQQQQQQPLELQLGRLQLQHHHHQQHHHQQKDNKQEDELQQQQAPGASLADLDESVLVQIAAAVEAPQALASTCTALAAVCSSSLCQQLWFARWQPRLAGSRPLVLAALSWRGVRRHADDNTSLAALLDLVRGTQRLQQQQQQQQHVHPTASTACGDEVVELLQQLTPWPEHLLLPAAAAGGHAALLQSLLAAGDEKAAAAAVATEGRRQQRPRCWLQQQLPGALGLAACQHDVLQTAILAAARGGSAACLSMLLQQLVLSPRRRMQDKVDLVVAAAEAAAAAGHVACLQEVAAVLDPKRHQSQHAAAQQHAQAGGPDKAAAVARAWARFQRMLTAIAHDQLHLLPFGTRLQRLVSGSCYLLVAAASSGCPDVFAFVLRQLQSRDVAQQLPAALAAAGQRGHLGTLRQLLHLHEISARPVQLAALDAATHGWPSAALDMLLRHAAANHRLELLQLLCKPLVASLQQHPRLAPAAAAATDAMLDTLAEHASLEHPELLSDVLLLLAQQGRAARVAWVLRVAPTVLVRLGQRAAAAALEGGHPRVAQMILDAGGERVAAPKAAAARGQLTAAVAAGDAQEVARLLESIALPVVWACEVLQPTGAGGAGVHAGAAAGGVGGYGVGAAAAAAAVANAPQAPLLPYLVDPMAPGPGAMAAIEHAAGVAGDAAVQGMLHAHEVLRQQSAKAPATRCLLRLLLSAALAPRPASVRLLRLLLAALPPQDSVAKERVLLALAKACTDAGRVAELCCVLDSPRVVGSSGPATRGLQRGFLVVKLVPFLQLQALRAPAGASAPLAAGSSSGGSSGSTCAADVQAQAHEEDARAEDSVSALLALMQLGGHWGSLLAAVTAHSYLSVSHPGEYLGALARPLLPAAHMPCMRQLAQLLAALAALPSPPGGAGEAALHRGGDATFELMVRTALQSCDVDVLHGFLSLMAQHGQPLLRSLQAPAELWRRMASASDSDDSDIEEVVEEEVGEEEGSGSGSSGEWEEDTDE